MFQLELTPKQKIKFHGDSENVQIAEKWEDWVTQTKILSGGNEIDFHPYPYQIKIAELMRDHSCVFLKSRQCGLSTVTLSVLIHQALRSRGFQALCFSRTGTDSSLLATNAQYALGYCGAKLETDSKMDIIIKNGGRLRFLNSNINSARGAASVNSILWDECAFQPFLASLRESASPCMSMLGDRKREFFVSTPNQKFGLYWELVDSGNPEPIENICKKIVSGEYPPFYWYIDKNGFAKIFVWWKAHPLYGQNPLFLIDKHEKDLIPWSVLNREYNLDFSSEAEGQFFTSLSLQKCWLEGLFEERAEEGAFYCGALDTNDGGEDYCVLSIWKKVKRKFYLVHTYRANYGTFDKHLEMILISIAKFPNQLLTVEKNSTGYQYYQQIKRRMPDLNIDLISTSATNKPSMIYRIKALIEARRIFWEPGDSIQKEFESYLKLENKYEACSGQHDDFISGLAVMLENLDQKGFLGGY